MAFFNLPFGNRIAGAEPVDGDRYTKANSAARDALITELRAFEGMQVFTQDTGSLWILITLGVDIPSSIWLDITGSIAGISPGGGPGDVQYNDGSAFAGTPDLFWDAVNGRLGIQTNAPDNPLTVIGSIRTSTDIIAEGAKIASLPIGAGTDQIVTVDPTGILGKSSGTSQASNVPIGGIIMYSGLFSAIPTGWQLCDGTNGAPQLTDRFIKPTNIEAELAGLGGDASTGASPVPVAIHSHSASATFNGVALADHNHVATFNGITLPEHSHIFSGIALGSHTHSGVTSSQRNSNPDLKILVVVFGEEVILIQAQQVHLPQELLLEMF